jgi:hypothetical protein
MSRYSLLSGATVMASCFIGCNGASDGFSPTGQVAEAGIAGHGGSDSDPEQGGSADAAAGQRNTLTGTAGRAGAGSGGRGGAGSGGNHAGTSGGKGGNGGRTATAGIAEAEAGTGEYSAGAAGDGGGCETPSALCAVIPEIPCEFSQAAGASAVVACGQSATVAQLDCGGCGYVKVQVYFDGRHCFQGIEPSCLGKGWLYPHLP